MTVRTESGFTLIELMIVVVVIGILAAIAIPNYVRMQDHAKEGSVKANMHAVQLAVEDFAVLNAGVYPVAANSAAVIALLPMGVVPPNPFGGATAVDWTGAPTTSGNLGFTTATTTNYVLRGYGKSALIPLALTNS